MKSFGGVEVLVSELLPIEPTYKEQARRIVRHGLADVLEWLGEKVGPKPDERTQAIWASDGTLAASPVLFVSRDLYASLREASK